MFFVIPRGEAYTRLQDGRLDVLAGGVTVTTEREKLVDFTEPIYSDFKEIVVMAPGAPPLNSVDDLSGKSVYVRKSSSYVEHIQTLNDRFQKEGKPPISMAAVPEDIGDEDLL